MRWTRAAVAVACGAVMVLTGAGEAQAAPSTFTISTVEDLHLVPHTPPTGTFTAAGLPGCVSGTYADSLVYFVPPGTRLVVDETYACAGGGTFTARTALHVAVTAPDGTQAIAGTWRIISSDTGLAGSGDVTAEATGCSPTGVVFSECTGSTGQVVANLK